MSKDSTFGGVVKLLDIPAAAGSVLRQSEGSIKSANPAGGEVDRANYQAKRGGSAK